MECRVFKFRRKPESLMVPPECPVCSGRYNGSEPWTGFTPHPHERRARAEWLRREHEARCLAVSLPETASAAECRAAERDRTH